MLPAYSGPGSNEGVLRKPQTPSLVESYHQTAKCHIQDSHWGCGVTLLHRCCWFILLLTAVWTAFSEHDTKLLLVERQQF